VEQDVRLDARFYLKPSNRPRDLDNMLKNLIDALGGAGLFKPSRGGGKASPWNTDDHWICGIDADKDIDTERPRTEVIIWVREDAKG
jgi:hypothetical protein